MRDLETLMQDLLRGVERKAVERHEQSASLDFGEEQRRKEVQRLLNLLPAIPSNWRILARAPIVAAISRWRWGDGNLVFLGDTGCGKTLGAAALAKRLLTEPTTEREWSRARRLVFVDAAQLAVAREQHGLGQGEAPLVQRCVNAPLLVLDELGYLDKETGVIEQVVDARNKARRPMIVTSGMMPGELQERYGSATTRKMMSGRSNDAVIQVFGP